MTLKESLPLTAPPPSPTPSRPGADSSHCWSVSAFVVWPPVNLGSQEALLVLKKKKNLAHHESVLLGISKNGLSSDKYSPRGWAQEALGAPVNSDFRLLGRLKELVC